MLSVLVVAAAPMGAARAQLDRDMEWARENWRSSRAASEAAPAFRQQPLQKRRIANRREQERSREPATKAASRAGDASTRVAAAPREPEPATEARRTVSPTPVSAVAPPAPLVRPPALPSGTRRTEPAVAPRRDAPTVGQAPDPLVAVISLSSQRMQVYSPGGTMLETRVSTGKPGHATPQGIYSIIQRNRHHRSNIYSGAPMPYMQRITWSGIALHQGVVPNHPASHGCIRLPNEVAIRMWAVGRMGMRVIVANHDLTPIEIVHPKLPAPVMTPVAVSELQTSVRTAAVTDATGPRLVDAFQLAHVRKARAARALIEAEAAVKPAMERAQETAAAANRSGEALRAQQATIAAFEERLEEHRDQMRRVQTPEAEERARAAIAAAATELAEATRRLPELKTAEMAASEAAFDAVKALRQVETAVVAAADGVKLANWGTEPVSIFVSRKEGRVYVRQSFNQIHEETIEIRDPERPLGTHVFTAMHAADSDASLMWMAVTMPSKPPEVIEAQRQGRQARGREAAPAPRPVGAASSAREALDRIELPERTRRLVVDRLWPGASLIVSDYAASGETGRGTDFIVQPK